jgi:putative addiction module CopG family antidote
MAYPFPADVRRQVDDRLAVGSYATEDDVLRDALRALDEEDEDLEAVRAAVRELHSGDAGLPLDEAFDLARQAIHQA